MTGKMYTPRTSIIGFNVGADISSNPVVWLIAVQWGRFNSMHNLNHYSYMRQRSSKLKRGFKTKAYSIKQFYTQDR